jgi:hypothetical protein
LPPGSLVYLREKTGATMIRGLVLQTSGEGTKKVDTGASPSREQSNRIVKKFLGKLSNIDARIQQENT